MEELDISIYEVIDNLYTKLAKLYPNRVILDKDGKLDEFSFPTLLRAKNILKESLSEEFFNEIDDVYKQVIIDAILELNESVDEGSPRLEVLEDIFDFNRDLMMENLEDEGFTYFFIPYLEDSHEKLDVENFRQKLIDCDEDIEVMEETFSNFEMAIYQVMVLVDIEALSTYIPIDLEGHEIFRMYELCQFYDLTAEELEDGEDYLEEYLDEE